MSRKVAREILFKLVFENCFHDDEDFITYKTYLENNGEDFDPDFLNQSLDDENKEFVKQNLIGVIEHKNEIIENIKDNLVDYSIERLFKIDLAILLIAVHELKYSNISKEIVINEAVELAKKYSTDKSYSFINGVLAKF